ncbi:hypothetical protein Taro_001695 [Colocasia esculenta]|uniref:Uncharacterized protein n=1 Tax=Colocasia esculenta TaxID=4460 RepID=A0A843TAM9_COLES|nr:hypothetical protein [Colocasia esculenta]
MEVQRSKLKEEPHLSGAYIRSLVKQLTSSRPREAQQQEHPGEAADGSSSSHNKIGQGYSGGSQQHQARETQPQPKKQVRRRLHTVKPYQERLLNMADARREIVAALKLHRAAMKRANEQQQQQRQLELETPHVQQVPCLSPPVLEEPQNGVRPRSNLRAYTSNSSATIYNDHFNSSSISSLSYIPPFPWSQIPSEPFFDNFSLAVPTRPLGLNLNLHDFNNIDTTPCDSNSNPPTHSSSCSNSFAPHSMSPPEVMSTMDPPLSVSEVTLDPTVVGLHPAMNDEEMAEIRLIGEQHGVEWNDKMNLVTSAWWCKFLKTVEMCPQGQQAAGIGGEGVEGDGLQLSDKLLEVPAWLTDQQHLDDYLIEGYLQDASLPRLNIGEIEDMDCDWLP